MAKEEPYFRFRSLEELLKDLDGPLSFLSRDFNIPGMSPGDIKQELSKHLIEVYNKKPEYYAHRKDGFWFIRSRWHLLNIRSSAFKRDPLANSISIDSFMDGGGPND